MRRRVSYRDLEAWPDDGRRYELYDGEVSELPSPLPVHQIVADNFCRMLSSYAHAHGGLAITSPIDIVFSDYDVLQPDVIFFSAARRHLVKLRAPIRHRPDLAVEVLSPGTTARDRGKKLQMFARYGVPEYWIVDPDNDHIEILTLAGPGYPGSHTLTTADTLRSGLLPGLSVAVADLFPQPD